MTDMPRQVRFEQDVFTDDVVGLPGRAEPMSDAFPITCVEHEGKTYGQAQMKAPYTWDEASTFPQVVRVCGKTMIWTGWNSDSGRVYYREIEPGESIGRGKTVRWKGKPRKR